MQQNKADKFNLTNFMKYKYIIFIDKVKKTIETKIRLKDTGIKIDLLCWR